MGLLQRLNRRILDSRTTIYHSTLNDIIPCMMESLFSEYDNDDHLRDRPPWFHQARTFVDLRFEEAQEFNHLLDSHLPDHAIRWDCEMEYGWTFEFEDLVLDVSPSEIDPVGVHATSWTMPRAYIDPLRRNLRHILAGPLDSRHDMKGFAMILLRLAEEASIFLHEWRPAEPQNLSNGRGLHKGWNLADMDRNAFQQQILENQSGMDVNAIDSSADSLMGASIKSICEGIPEEYRIIHVEPVFRDDLVRRFHRKQKRIFDDLMELSDRQLRQCVSYDTIPKNSALDNWTDLANEICKPCVTFHGTQRRAVSSIVRHGFVKPGDRIGKGEKNSITFGASFGVGIYSSPDAEYALFYSNIASEFFDDERTRPEDLPGLRLIVCATLMGRALEVTREATRRTTEIVDKTARSHISPNKCEYVIFDAAQIIPCYVIHVDMGACYARIKAMIPPNPGNWKSRRHPKFRKANYVFPVDIEAEKQRRKEVAAKWFPYGYGPATGTSFVIEEIGATSDDEEDYGEYQGQRKEVGDEVRKRVEELSTEGANWFDLYQTARQAHWD